MSKLPNVTGIAYTRYLLAFFFYFTIIRIRFAGYNFRHLAGDDLYLLIGSNQPGGYASKILPSFLDHGGGKWRPVTQVILSPLLDLFGEDFWKYQLVAEALLSLIGVLVALIIVQLVGKSSIWAFLAGSLVALSNFNLYFVLQVFGIMESLALLFFLITIALLSRPHHRFAKKDFLAAGVTFALSLHSHERYMLICFAVAALIYFRMQEQCLRERLLFSSVPFAAVLFNYLVKEIGFGMNFFTGAGGTEISSSSIDIPYFLLRASLNVLGYNVGPDYLSGKDASTLGSTGALLSLIWAIPAIMAMTCGCLHVIRTSRARGWAIIALCLLTISSLLLTASVAFRQEFRWLLAPQLAVLIVAVSSGLSAFGQRPIRLAVLTLLLAGFTINGVYYTQYSESTYFFDTQRLNDSIAERLFVQYRAEIPNTSFVIATGDSPTFMWGTAGGQVFSEFGKHRGVEEFLDVHLVPDFTLTDSLQGLRDNVILFEFRRNQIVQVHQGPEASQ